LRELLLKSARPLVIAGGGGWTPQAAQALQRFAENWQLPVGNAFSFQDTFDNLHPLYAGDVGIGINPRLAARIKASDLVIAIGPRLGEMTTGGYTLIERAMAPKQTLVHIHSSAEELNRVYQADLAHLRHHERCRAQSGSAGRAAVTLPWADWSAAVHADFEANRVPQDAAR
jgi:acetolactate synthase-1/2/3 large subunit